MKLRLAAITTMLALGLGLPTSSTAGTIFIEFGGLDLVYDGSFLFDAGGLAGGAGDPATADPLTSITFAHDTTFLGVLTADIYADILLPVSGISSGGDLILGITDGGIVDLLVKSTTPGWGLALNTTTFDVAYLTTSQIILTGGLSVVWAQDLPFDLVMSDPVRFSISLSLLTAIVDDESGDLESFLASGNGNLNGSGTQGGAVPEPSSVMLLGAGLVAAALGLRRRRGN